MRYSRFIIPILLSIPVLWFNIKLYDGESTRKDFHDDLVLQLNYLEDEIKEHDMGNRMQDVFPEGYVFTHALYGLAWTEVGLSLPQGDSNRIRALHEALYAYDKLNSEKARLIFPTNVQPKYGVFYQGWINLLLAKIIQLDVDRTVVGSERIAQYQTFCNELSKAMDSSSTPYLESYRYMAWPSDMTVAVAAMSQYKKLYDHRYESKITDWLQSVGEHLDKQTNLIAHQVDAGSGNPIQGARGGSMALMLRMLYEIDVDFGSKMYERFCQQFGDSTFGLPSIREYPKGTSGKGDVDSGPIILGVGFSATIVAFADHFLYGIKDKGFEQLQTIHAFGFDQTNKHRKRYLFGFMPMGDAFIAWGRASALQKLHDGIPTSYFVRFHLYSLVLLLLVWAPLYVRTIIKSFRNQKTNGNQIHKA